MKNIVKGIMGFMLVSTVFVGGVGYVLNHETKTEEQIRIEEYFDESYKIHGYTAVEDSVRIIDNNPDELNFVWVRENDNHTIYTTLYK